MNLETWRNEKRLSKACSSLVFCPDWSESEGRGLRWPFHRASLLPEPVLRGGQAAGCQGTEDVEKTV